MKPRAPADGGALGLDSVPSTSEFALPAGTTVAAALVKATARLRDAGVDTPGLDARRLALAVIGGDSAGLLRAPERALTAGECRHLCGLVARRLDGEPVSRIEGWRHFHGLAFEISPATLDPRPETETLVEGILGWLETSPLGAGRSRAPRILDLGTGSGAILIALLARLP